MLKKFGLKTLDFINRQRNLKLKVMISNKKFHQVAMEVDLKQLINPIEEENIISKYLQGKEQMVKKSNILANKFYKKDQKIQTQENEKINYKQILAENSRGSIIIQQYKDSELCLMGMNYSNVGQNNIYKTLLKFEPDCILIQNRPEYFCDNFEIIKKNPSTQIFSDKLYLQQLLLNQNFNLKQNFNENAINDMQKIIFPRKKTNLTNHNQYFPFLNKQLVSQKPLITSIYNSLKRNTPIYLAELPESVYREWICNTHTLMELQEIFKITCKSLPLYPGISQLTPYQLGAYLFPEQFLSVNDKYMSTLIEMMIALGYKKIMLLCGIAQNEAIWKILNFKKLEDQKGDIKPLINYLIAQKPLEIIEKHILFDALFHGSDITQVKVSKFQTTNKIIEKYAKDQPKEMIFKFRYEMCMKYSELLKEYIDEGQKRKRKQFMRTVIKKQI